MKRLLLFLICCVTFTGIVQAQYTADVLPGFEQQRIRMNPDKSGEVICTIVRKKASSPTNRAVLYIHGFCDYFFQTELANYFTTNGIDFYALDLRKYGRSLLTHQRANECRNLNEYFADIDTALSIIKAEGHSNILINAHSTGGLTTVLYAKSKEKSIKKYNNIVLNSPFLSMNQSGFNEKILIPIVSTLGTISPRIPLPKGVSTLYGESISKQHRGEWEYNAEWKPLVAFQMDAGWLRAIHKGHKKVKRGLDLQDNILVISSDKSVYGNKWTEEFREGDAVLDVKEIQKLGGQLGPNARTIVIPGALHDLALSKKEVREKYYKLLIAN